MVDRGEVPPVVGLCAHSLPVLVALSVSCIPSPPPARQVFDARCLVRASSLDEMLSIPAGTFVLGLGSRESATPTPPHVVDVTAFLLDANEVTVAAYNQVHPGRRVRGTTA